MSATPTLTVRKEGGEYLLTMAGFIVPAALYASATPYASNPTLIDNVSPGSLRIPPPLPGVRTYFALEAGTNRLIWAADRAVEIKSVENFRDMGGYPAQGGRTVRWGRFFRSGEVCRLTDADRETFSAMGIARVLDYRSHREATDSPDCLPGNVRYLHAPAFVAGGEAAQLVQMEMRQSLEAVRTKADAQRLGAMFAGIYSVLPFGNDAYRLMFESLDEADRLPLLQHCHAGKDRTGVACALLLLALGVSRETVMEDYLLTATFRKGSNGAYLSQLAQSSLSAPALALAGEMLTVSPALLTDTLDAIDARYNSFEAFLAAEYGVDQKRLARWLDMHMV